MKETIASFSITNRKNRILELIKNLKLSFLEERRANKSRGGKFSGELNKSLRTPMILEGMSFDNH